MAAISLLPAVNTFATEDNRYDRMLNAKPKMRFALASDGHYGQPGTDYKTLHADIVRWLNEDHAKNHFDFIIINGDLVHGQPELLPELKATYLDKLKAPYYTIPGNHDFADAALWENIFGYKDNYVVDKGEVGLILANTADIKGKYICPDVSFMTESLDKFSSKRIVFVILHIPPVIWLKGEPFVDCPEVMHLLEKAPNVKALFHGHEHSLDNMRRSAKLPHFFDSHIGGSWGTDYKGYRVVEVGNDNKIHTYQVNASRNPVLNSTKI